MLEQIMVTGQLEALSALHIGTGDFEALDSLGLKIPEVLTKDEKKRTSQVSTVVRDCNGLPCIPATTLKGCLKSACRESDLTADLTFIFGQITEHDQDRGEKGRLHFLLCQADPCSVPKALDMPCYNEAKASYILPRVAINRHSGTADDHKLFSQEMVPQGVRFGLRLRFLGTPQEFNDKVKPVLGLLAREQGLSLGKGQGLGQGRLKLVQGSLRAVYTSFDAQAFKLREEKLPPIELSAPAPSPGKLAYELDLVCRGPYLTSDPYRAGRSDDKTDPASKALQYEDGKSLLLPSSLLGVLRSKMAWQQALLRENRGKTCEAVDNPERKPASWASAKELTTTERIFGVTGWRKLIRVESLKLEGAPKSCVLTSVALDRFTGGPLDGALFATQAYHGVEFSVRLGLESRRHNGVVSRAGDDDDEKAFHQLVESIKKDGLILGHGGNKGFGWFEVTEKKGGDNG